MRNVTIICVGSLKEKYWKDACAEYAKRLSSFCKFEIAEISETRLPENPSGTEIQKALAAEGSAILKKAGNSLIVPLCVEGEEIDSVSMSRFFEESALGGTSAVSFVIGSSYGLSESVKQAGTKRLSLSKMTFPHQLARVMLCEQIYRAFMILANTKYHK